MRIKELNHKKDIERVCDLAQVIWKEHFPGIISDSQIEYMLDKFLSFDVLSNEIKHGYECDGLINDNDELIGFMLYNFDADEVFLSKLYLLKSYRGHAYASQAFNHLVNKAKSKKAKRIWLTCNKTNEKSLRVYYHWGFKKFDDVVNDIGNGYVMDDYYLEYQLEGV